MGMKKFFSLVVLATFLAVATASAHKFTLVLDAGHGGHDTGAAGAISKEKDLTLKYALAFGRLIERKCPDVKVYYTRTTDVFVTLSGRAAFANMKKADLFVSVHINAEDIRPTRWGAASATETARESTKIWRWLGARTR